MSEISCGENFGFAWHMNKRYTRKAFIHSTGADPDAQPHLSGVFGEQTCLLFTNGTIKTVQKGFKEAGAVLTRSLPFGVQQQDESFCRCLFFRYRDVPLTTKIRK